MAENNIYGIWGHNLITNLQLFNLYAPVYKGFHFRFDWSGFETAANVWNSDYITDQMEIAINAGMNVSFLVFVSPYSGDATPSYLFSAPYSVPLVTTTRGTYPYYYNANYKTRFNNLFDNIRALMASLPDDWKAKIVAWQSCEGTTGDESPYKGTINNVRINGSIVCNSAGACSAYNISTSSWEDFKRDEVWAPMYTNIENDIPFLKPLINQSNEATNFQWVLDNTPPAWMKAGNPTHTYNMSGEQFYVQRLRSVWGNPSGDNRIRGELEEIPTFAWWKQAKKQNLFSVIASCAHHGIDMLNIAPAYAYNMVGTDLWGFQFANKYYGIRDADETNVAFCAFRKVVDFADTTLYPENIYGALVSPADLAAYTAAYNAIANNADLDEWEKPVQYTLLLAQGKAGNTYLNPARITAIRALYPSAAYRGDVKPDQEADAYSQDCGIYMIPDNYYKYITQYSPETTSVPAWRLGSTSGWEGRFARGFDNANGKTEMFLTVDEGLDSEGATGNNVTIDITYYDSGTGIWSLYASTLLGKSEVMVTQNKNTNTWITKSITFDGFLFGGLLDNNSDITLKWNSSGDVFFHRIEFKNNSKIV